jgi:Zn-dependent protease
MFNKKEIIVILVATIIIAFSANFLFGGWTAFLWTLLAVFFVILINVFAKKISSFYLDSETEIKFWELESIGIRKRRHLKKPLIIGAFMPLISKIILLPVQGLAWMASLAFEVKPKTYRAARRHGLYTFSEMTEKHIGYIAAAGILANMIFAVIGYLIGFTEFSRLNIYYALFNLLPISNLDGNKIFFGNLVLWSFLACLAVVGLFFIIFIV